MISESGNFDGADGIKLFERRWLPDADPVAALVISHGFGEHSERYAGFAEAAVSAGVAVHAYDHRGHGLSQGRRGHVRSLSEYREDLHSMIGSVSVAYAGRPLFLWGHSMGSLIALDYAIRRPESLRGVITSGVGLEPAGVATRTVVMTARFFSTIWPTFPLNVPLNSDMLSRDERVIAEYNEDERVHGDATARWAVSMLDAIDWIKTHASDLQLPLLMQHGGADAINLPSGSENFIAAVTIADKTLIIYPGSRHEPHNDFDRDKMANDLVGWISERS